LVKLPGIEMNLFLPLLFLFQPGPDGFQKDLLTSTPDFGKKTENQLVYKTRTNVYYPSILFRFSMIDFDFTHFNDLPQNTVGQQFKSVIPSVGASYEFPIKFRKGSSFDNYIELNYLIPQTLKNGGSMEENLKGGTASIACGRDLVSQDKRFDLIVAMGLTGGLLHCGVINYINNYGGYTYNQYYFGPQLSVFPKLIIKQFLIGARGAYRIDLLKRAWTGDTGAGGIPPAICNGWTAELVIGIQLGVYY
jgi:hypothetical protein